MFDWVENRLQAKGLKYWAHSCSQSFKLSRKNTQPENMCHIIFENIEPVVQRCSVRKVFLEISQNSQENASARVYYFEIKFPQHRSTGVFMWIFEISKNTFLHRTPLVAASENKKGIYAEPTVQSVL